MKKLIKISIERQLDESYKVELLEIKDENQVKSNEAEGITGTLPPANNIYEIYRNWQVQYENILTLISQQNSKILLWKIYLFRWAAKSSLYSLIWYFSSKLGYSQQDFYCRGEFKFLDDVELPTEVSIERCNELATQFKVSFNEWLDDKGFTKIEKRLMISCSNFEQIRILIKTTDYDLWNLPWSVWDFFEYYPNAEVLFSPLESRWGEQPINANRRRKVKIFALFGESTGLDFKGDRNALNSLRSAGAEPQIFKEPTLEEVRNLLWNQSWDIFFFAGHSRSRKDRRTGHLYVNSKESLTPDQVNSTLKTAIYNGLKIVFLISCDGLGLAHDLVTEFHIPLVMVMREPVSNIVAQKFLNYFLSEYAHRKKPIHIAIRQARQRIGEEYQEQLPSVDWLPVIVQNPAIRPPMWEELHRPVSIAEVGIASLACTSVVMLARFFGLLQPIELSAFDKLMQMRPVTEPPDKRLLIVEVTQRDIEKQYQYPISDRTVEQVLSKLERFQPRVIGLDIYRESPRYGDRAGYEALQKYLKESDHVIATCRLQEPTSDDAANVGISSPSGVPKDRLGFADLPKDKDGTVRLQFLGMEPAESDLCQTSHSLSFELALRYLEQEDSIQLDEFQDPIDNSLHLPKQGGIVFKQLKSYTGGYPKLDEEDMGGFQVLLNYRASQQIAEKVSLTDVLDNRIDPKLVINRAVLVGYTAEGIDRHSTPIAQEMPGVVIHAHMVSQILNAVLDGRSLLWVWSWWGDCLWVLSWSLLGGLFVWQIQKPLILVLTEGFLLIALPVSCLMILIQGGWMALIPSALALVFTVGGLLVYIIFPNLKQN